MLAGLCTRYIPVQRIHEKAVKNRVRYIPDGTRRSTIRFRYIPEHTREIFRLFGYEAGI